MGKTIVAVFGMFFLLTGLFWAQGSRLGNQDVIDMVTLGLSDEVVIEKIRVAPETNFDTSLQALKALKAAKVSDAVIRVMINPKASPSKASPMVGFTAPPSVPGFPSNATVAYKRPDGSFTALDQCPAPNTKSGGTGKFLLTQGLSGVKEKSVYRGAEAPLRIEERRPTFYVRSSSERNFALVRLEKKGNHRELEVSRVGFNGGTGLREKDRVETTVTRIVDGMFSVIPVQELSNGEYLVTFDEMGAVSFDFGIAVAK